MSAEILHLQVTEIACPATVLEPIVSCTWEYVVIWPQVGNILESLHCWTVYKRPAVARQRDRSVDDIVKLLLLGRGDESSVWVDALALL